METGKSINLRINDYAQQGLYLTLKDSKKIALTREHIEKSASEYWSNPDKIPRNVKSAVDFQRCSFCPLKGKDEFCDAIRPVLPFLDVIDDYVSFDEVMAVYKEDKGRLLHVADTTMQEALRYMSLLSLMQYCRIGRVYWKYYMGIIPLIGGKEAAVRMYLNMYWAHKGNKEEIKSVISKFNGEIRVTSQNQVKRLSMICKSDAFMNAFVSTQAATEFLDMDIEKALESAFRRHDEA
ncbi:MAG: hypothetical protein ABH825_04160 [Candidatus Omnitrophota bacterium]